MKNLLIALVVLGLATLATATLLVTDSFNYTGALTANGWSAYSGADGSITSDTSVAFIGAGAEDIRLVYSEQLASPVYAALTLRVATLPATGSEYCWGFNDGTAMNSRWGIVVEGGGTAFGIGTYGTLTVLGPTFSGLSLNTDYVIAYYFDGVNDHRLWINPGVSDFSSPDLQTSAVPGAVGFDGVFLRQAGDLDNGLSSWKVDNVAVGTTWNDVVIPEPGTIALISMGLGLLLVRRFRQT
jgi:hypothetical protein